MNVPVKIYSETDLARARTKGKIVGWLQGGGVVLVGMLLWRFLSWMPIVLGGGAVIWILYKLLSKKSSEDAGADLDGKDGKEGEDGQ